MVAALEPWCLETAILPLPPGEGKREGKTPLPLGEDSGEDRAPGGTVRYPRLIPKDEECAKQLAKRTLTNLYNTRPTWLDLAHQRLDAAVAASYNWPPNLPDDEILSRLLARNLARANDSE